MPTSKQHNRKKQNKPRKRLIKYSKRKQVKTRQLYRNKKSQDKKQSRPQKKATVSGIKRKRHRTPDKIGDGEWHVGGRRNGVYKQKAGQRYLRTRRRRSHGSRQKWTDLLGSMNPTKRKVHRGGGGKYGSSCLAEGRLKQWKKAFKETYKAELEKHGGKFKDGSSRSRFWKSEKKKEGYEKVIVCQDFHRMLSYLDCYTELFKKEIQLFQTLIKDFISILNSLSTSYGKLSIYPYLNFLITSHKRLRKTYEKNIKDGSDILVRHDRFMKELFPDKNEYYSQYSYNQLDQAQIASKNYQRDVKGVIKKMDQIQDSIARLIEIDYSADNLFKKITQKLPQLPDSPGEDNSPKVELQVKKSVQVQLNKIDDIAQVSDIKDTDTNRIGSLSQLRKDITSANEKINEDMSSTSDNINTFFENLADRLKTRFNVIGLRYKQFSIYGINVNGKDNEMPSWKYLVSNELRLILNELYEQHNISDDSNKVPPEYRYQYIGKRFVNSHDGYCKIIFKHPKNKSSYYIPSDEQVTETKSSISKLPSISNLLHRRLYSLKKNRSGRGIESSSMTLIHKEVLLGRLKNYKKSYTQGGWEENEYETNDKEDQKLIDNTLAERNIISYVFDKIIFYVATLMSGGTISDTQGRDSSKTQLSGFMPYILQSAARNLVHIDHIFATNDYNKYTIPCYLPVYRQLESENKHRGGNVNINDNFIPNQYYIYDKDVPRLGNNVVKPQLDCTENKFSLLTDINHMYDRFRRHIRIQTSDNNNDDDTRQLSADTYQLVHQKTVQFPPVLRDQPPQLKMFYKGYLMDRQYMGIIGRGMVVGTDNGDSYNILQRIDSTHPAVFRLELSLYAGGHRAVDVYHWAGKPKYLDGIITFPTFVNMSKESIWYYPFHTRKCAFDQTSSDRNAQHIHEQKPLIDTRTATIKEILDDPSHNDLYINFLNNDLSFEYDYSATVTEKIQHKMKPLLYPNYCQLEKSLYTENKANILYFMIVNCLGFNKYFQNVYDQHITETRDFNRISYYAPREISTKTFSTEVRRHYVPQHTYLNFLEPESVFQEANKIKHFKAIEYDNYGFMEQGHLTRPIPELKHPEGRIETARRWAMGAPVNPTVTKLADIKNTVVESGDEIKIQDYTEDYRKYRRYQQYIAKQFGNNHSIALLSTPVYQSLPERNADTYSMPFNLYRIPYYRQERDARYLQFLENHRHNNHADNLRVAVDSDNFSRSIDFIPNFWYRIQSYIEHMKQVQRDLSLYIKFTKNVKKSEEKVKYMTPQYVPPGYYTSNTADDEDKYFSMFHHDLEDRIILYKTPIEMFNYDPQRLVFHQREILGQPNEIYINPYNMMKYPHYFCFHEMDVNNVSMTLNGGIPQTQTIDGVPNPLPPPPAQLQANQYQYYSHHGDQLNMLTVFSKPSAITEIIFLYILQSLDICLMDELKHNGGEDMSDLFLNEYLTLYYYIFLPMLLSTDDINFNDVKLKPLTVLEEENYGIEPGVYSDDEGNNFKQKFNRPIFENMVENMYSTFARSPGGVMLINNQYGHRDDNTNGLLNDLIRFRVGGPYRNAINAAIVATTPASLHEVHANAYLAGFRANIDSAINILEGYDDIGNLDLILHEPLVGIIPFLQYLVDNHWCNDSPGAGCPNHGAVGNIGDNAWVVPGGSHHRFWMKIQLMITRSTNSTFRNRRSIGRFNIRHNNKKVLKHACLNIPFLPVPQSKTPMLLAVYDDPNEHLIKQDWLEYYPENPYVNVIQNHPTRRRQARGNERDYNPLHEIAFNIAKMDPKLGQHEPNKPLDGLRQIQFRVPIPSDKFTWRQTIVTEIKEIFKASPNGSKELVIKKKEGGNIALYATDKVQKFIERYLTLYETPEWKYNTSNVNQFDNNIAIGGRQPQNHRYAETNYRHAYQENSDQLHIMKLYNPEPVYPQAFPDVTKYFPLGVGAFCNKDAKFDDPKKKYSDNYIPDETLPREKYVTLEKLFKQPIQYNPKSKVIEQMTNNRYASSKMKIDIERLIPDKQQFLHFGSQDRHDKTKTYFPMGRLADFEYEWNSDTGNHLVRPLAPSILYNNIVDNRLDANVPLSSDYSPWAHTIPNWNRNYNNKSVYVMNGLFLSDDLDIKEHLEIKQLFDPDNFKFPATIDNTSDGKRFNNKALDIIPDTVDRIVPAANGGGKLNNPKTRTNRALINNTSPPYGSLKVRANGANMLKHSEYIPYYEGMVDNSAFRHLGFLPSGIHPDQLKIIKAQLPTTDTLELEYDMGDKLLHNIRTILKYHLKHLNILCNAFVHIHNLTQNANKADAESRRSQAFIKEGRRGSKRPMAAVIGSFSTEDNIKSIHRDYMSQNFFNLTKDIMLYFIDSGKRHINSYYELISSIKTLTQHILHDVDLVMNHFHSQAKSQYKNYLKIIDASGQVSTDITKEVLMKRIFESGKPPPDYSFKVLTDALSNIFTRGQSKETTVDAITLRNSPDELFKTFQGVNNVFKTVITKIQKSDLDKDQDYMDTVTYIDELVKILQGGDKFTTHSVADFESPKLFDEPSGNNQKNKEEN